MTNTKRNTSGWKVAIFLGALLALGVTACGDDAGSGSGPYTLVFSGSGYDPHDMQTLRVALVDVAANQVIATDEVVVADGSFSFNWPDVLEKDRAYRIDFYADMDGDGECDNPPDDHVWSVSIQGVDTDTVVVQDHVLDFSPSACDSFPGGPLRFDVSFSGTGFEPHDMQTLYAALVRVDNGNVVEEGETTVSGGTFSFSWPSGVEQGRAYRLDYFADVNGDGFCGDPDHIWSVDIPAVTGDVVVEEAHSTNFTPSACDSFSTPQTFDLTFEGTGFDPHDSQDLHVALVRSGDGHVVATDQVTITGGEFTFDWQDAIEEGQEYHLDFYADVDGSGTCADPDHIWREAIPTVVDDVTVTYAHGVDFEPLACASF